MEQGNRRGEPRAYASFPRTDFSTRRQLFSQYRAVPPAIFAPASGPATPTRKALATLQDARDLALLYLALIAEKEPHAEEFVKRLGACLETLPVEERGFAWAAVENPANLLREIAALPSQPIHGRFPSRFQAFCAEELRLITPHVDDATKGKISEVAKIAPQGRARKGRATSKPRRLG